MLKLRPERVNAATGEVVQRGRRCNGCLQVEAEEREAKAARNKAAQGGAKENPSSVVLVEANSAGAEEEVLGMPPAVARLANNVSAMVKAGRITAAEAAFFGGRQEPLSVEPGPTEEELEAEEEAAEAEEALQELKEEERLLGLIAGKTVLIKAAPVIGRVSFVTVTGYDTSGEVVEEELAPGTEVQVVETWTGDMSEGVPVTGIDANGGILWNVNGAETVGPWTVWPSMLGCRGVGTYCKLGVGLEDYSRVVAWDESNREEEVLPLFTNPGIDHLDGEPIACVWVPALYYHPEIGDHYELGVMGYIDAEAGRSFRLLYIHEGWAFIVDADRPDGCEAGTGSVKQPRGKFYEDPHDYLSDVLEFDTERPLRTVTEEPYQYEWPDGDEEVRDRLVNLMGEDRRRCDGEVDGCLVMMKQCEENEPYVPVWRKMVWVSTEFLLPV